MTLPQVSLASKAVS